MYAHLFPLIFAIMAGPATAQAGAPTLVFPVACQIGEACLIQKLVDHDPGPGRRDYRCGALTTDGHDGTDIRLRTMADMRAGYAVVAAHAGTVLRIRDGEPDTGVTRGAEVSDKMAGNAVVIDHGNGWQTQYSHLRQGSVRVRPGQVVAAGQPIGLIGLSGNSEFPHLHFTVRHRDIAQDPFTGVGLAQPCDSAADGAGLWSPAARSMVRYRPAAVIAAGLAAGVPAKAVVGHDRQAMSVSAHSPLILWVDAIGAKAGDGQDFSIVGPDGRTVHSQSSDVADGGLSWFAYSGKRAPPTGWQKGRYVGRYVLRRGQVIVAQADMSASIK